MRELAEGDGDEIGLTPDERFERSSRPLLVLVQRLTRLETSFLTRIDWDAQSQEVVFAANASRELEVAEGSVVAWSDSMCRWAFLTGKDHTADVPTDFPGSLGGDVLGMQTFFAVPILAGDVTIGSVCGASRSRVELGEQTIGDMTLIAESLAFQMAAHLEHRRDRLRADEALALAMNDALTGLANRRAFNSRLEEELARSARHKMPLSLLVIDVDLFKTVNDTFGHGGGDDVLRILADLLRQSARTEDVAARLGGDEFALLLTETDPEGATSAAARISAEFRRASRAAGRPATLSIGMASTPGTDRRSLLAAADDALYRSKREGRDRFLSAS